MVNPMSKTCLQFFYFMAISVFVNALNKYEILNSNGQRVFLAAETTDFLTRLCYGGFQPFNISVYNSKPNVTLGPKNEKKSKSFLEVMNMHGYKYC